MFPCKLYLLLLAIGFMLQMGIAANIDRANLPEIPLQHIVLKQKVINPTSMQNYKQCIANCVQSEMNKYPHDKMPGKQNVEAIQKCSDKCNRKR